MTRSDVVTQLRVWIREFAIDPHDAGLVLEQVEDEVDSETFGDYLDGAGYPELAAQAYA
jgi:hypothetical protein